MNPRQRRGVLLISVAAIAAAFVFFAINNYLRDVRTQLGPMVTVVAAANDLPAHATPSPDDLVVAEMPQRWLPPNVFSATAQIGDQVTATTVPAGSILSQGMFVERPQIGVGEREIAILVDAETGVAGKITSGSVVDIIAAFDGADGRAPSVRFVVQRAEIIAVGSPIDVGEDGVGPGSVGFGSGDRLPVTFLLSAEDARTLAYVESFARSIRLALRSPLDDVLLPSDVAIFSPDIGELGGGSPDSAQGDTPADTQGGDTTPPDTEEDPPPLVDEDEGDDGDDDDDGEGTP